LTQKIIQRIGNILAVWFVSPEHKDVVNVTGIEDCIMVGGASNKTVNWEYGQKERSSSRPHIFVMKRNVRNWTIYWPCANAVICGTIPLSTFPMPEKRGREKAVSKTYFEWSTIMDTELLSYPSELLPPDTDPGLWLRYLRGTRAFDVEWGQGSRCPENPRGARCRCGSRLVIGCQIFRTIEKIAEEIGGEVRRMVRGIV